MALKTISSWTYFCGANAVVQLGQRTLGEAVAIQYRLGQNRTPLYGYNAPLFNAVADGQVLVQGVLAVNYVSHEYLIAAIKSNNDIAADLKYIFDVQLQKTPELIDDDIPGFATDELILSNDSSKQIAALRAKYWGQTKNSESDYNFDIAGKGNFGRPDQYHKSIDITVDYGDPSKSSFTRHILKDVFFIGRSMGTAITEDPQIEQFDFIARNII